jgi:hypothetical protein
MEQYLACIGKILYRLVLGFEAASGRLAVEVAWYYATGSAVQLIVHIICWYYYYYYIASFVLKRLEFDTRPHKTSHLSSKQVAPKKHHKLGKMVHHVLLKGGRTISFYGCHMTCFHGSLTQIDLNFIIAPWFSTIDLFIYLFICSLFSNIF